MTNTPIYNALLKQWQTRAPYQPKPLPPQGSSSRNIDDVRKYYEEKDAAESAPQQKKRSNKK